VGDIPNLNIFVNGTAAGLTCFIHPNTEFVGWPYGNGGINADPTSTTTGGGAESSSPAPGPSENDNGASQSGRWSIATIPIAILGCCLGFVFVF
jgi:hypothetical protein